MPRRRPAPPLDPDVTNFHDLVLSGDINKVNTRLALTPSLANSKDGNGRTPLMKVVCCMSSSESSSSSSSLSWQTQVQLIDTLVERGSASLAIWDRNSDNNLLMMACAQGVAPQVIDCLLRWNSKLGGEGLEWRDCNSNFDGALVLAARSGSIDLVQHLLSLDVAAIDLTEGECNEPIKILEAAIKSNNEKLVLLILRHEKIKNDINDVEETDYDTDWQYMYCVYGYEKDIPDRTISLDDCIGMAYERKMFDAVIEMASQRNDAPIYVWLFWRKSMLEANRRNRNNQDPKELVVATSSPDEGTTTTPSSRRRIEDIARACQENLVYEYNPGLLTLLLARSRYNNTSSSSSRKSEGSSSSLPHNSLVTVEDDVFRHIVKYSFTLNADALQKKVLEDKCNFQTKHVVTVTNGIAYIPPELKIERQKKRKRKEEL